MNRPRPSLLYRLHEPAFRTQYAEVKERSQAAGTLLPGTPGQLVLHEAGGRSYWYRRYYPVPGGKPADDFICKQGDETSREGALDAIAFSDWMARQLRALRKLDFQVADKDAARVLVELHNQGLFAAERAGLVVVGTLAFMAWLNELGARVVAARTQDIDLARRQPLKLAAPRSFLQTVQATSLKFSAIPTLSRKLPSTSVKLPGAAGLRVDLLADGPEVGAVIAVPELNWHAQTIPHFSYLLRDARAAVMLAGGHAVPVNLPSPERFVWHKLYSSQARVASRDKAFKDLLQAATLAAVLVEQDDAQLGEALHDAPQPLVEAARARLPLLEAFLEPQPPCPGRGKASAWRMKPTTPGNDPWKSVWPPQAPVRPAPEMAKCAACRDPLRNNAARLVRIDATRHRDTSEPVFLRGLVDTGAWCSQRKSTTGRSTSSYNLDS